MRLAVFALAAGLVGCSTSPPTSPAPQLAECSAANSSVPKYVEGGRITKPRVVHRIEPRGTGTILHYPAVATVEAVIGTDGVPTTICLASGDAVWGHAVASALQHWRFEPAKLDSAPVVVTMDFKMTHMPTTMPTIGWSGPCGSWGTSAADPCSGGRAYIGGDGGNAPPGGVIHVPAGTVGIPPQ